MVAILYNIRSLHNVGSIFRTADAAGVEKIYLCGYTPSPIDKYGHAEPKISKVALGAEKYIPWEKRGGTPQATVKLIRELRQSGYKVLAVEQSKTSVPFDQPDFKKKEFQKIALLVGNEVGGIPPSVLKAADLVIEIPMFGKKESLNVSVAFGIAAYQVALKQNKQKSENRT
jgi:tRNA G18 (ribose-2'-O)-methylase SpoU